MYRRCAKVADSNQSWFSMNVRCTIRRTRSVVDHRGALESYRPNHDDSDRTELIQAGLIEPSCSNHGAPPAGRSEPSCLSSSVSQPPPPYRRFLAMPGSVGTLPAASGGGWRGRRGCEQARHGALAAGPAQFAGSARPGAPSPAAIASAVTMVQVRPRHPSRAAGAVCWGEQSLHPGLLGAAPPWGTARGVAAGRACGYGRRAADDCVP